MSGSARFPGSASAQSLTAVRRVGPKYGFGAASRDVANKTFISQEHTLTIKYGTLSPGPAHYDKSPYRVAATKFNRSCRAPIRPTG